MLLILYCLFILIIRNAFEDLLNSNLLGAVFIVKGGITTYLKQFSHIAYTQLFLNLDIRLAYQIIEW